MKNSAERFDAIDLQRTPEENLHEIDAYTTFTTVEQTLVFVA